MFTAPEFMKLGALASETTLSSQQLAMLQHGQRPQRARRGDCNELELAATPVVSAQLYVTFLGQFSVQRAQHLLSFRNTRLVMELGRYLLAHQGRCVGRDELIELLWPDTDAMQATPRLHVATSTLRRIVDVPGAHDSIIQFHDDSYLLVSDSAVLDVDLLEKRYKAGLSRLAARDRAGAAVEFRAALEHYAGDYLADDRYAEWTFSARAHFIQRRISLLLYLSEHSAACHDPVAVGDFARDIVEIDNLCERAHRDLMRAHYQLGQRACAVRQFRTCQTILREELDVAPANLTQQLYRAICDDSELPPEPPLYP